MFCDRFCTTYAFLYFYTNNSIVSKEMLVNTSTSNMFISDLNVILKS